VKSWQVDKTIETPEASRSALYWFYEKLKQGISEINDYFEQYRISDALMTVYKLFWDDFASWYLEIIKPDYQKPVDRITYSETVKMMKILLKLLHPFVPFITEEIWQLLKESPSDSSIMYERMPESETYDSEKIAGFEHVKEVVSFIRNTRTGKGIPQKDQLVLKIKPVNYTGAFSEVIKKLGNLSSAEITEERIEGAVSLITSVAEYYIPLGDLHNKEEEISKLEKELEYNRGFLKSVMAKLGNSKFVGNAPPEVLEREQKKKEDTETKIKAIEEHIKSLKKKI
jgi:valyl-tRNA synthetase